jgi:hypothetical protein
MQPIPLKMPVPQPVKPLPSLRDVTLPAAGCGRRRRAATVVDCVLRRRALRKWIVIHHSDDVCGCCSTYDKIHRAKGWDECGYHFVIGNGSLTGDGEVEPSGRWPAQKHGAHAKTPDNRYNDFGIGIVLVGDFEKGAGPSAGQYEAPVNLKRWLMTRYMSPSTASSATATARRLPSQALPLAKFRPISAGDQQVGVGRGGI